MLCRFSCYNSCMRAQSCIRAWKLYPVFSMPIDWHSFLSKYSDLTWFRFWKCIKKSFIVSSQTLRSAGLYYWNTWLILSNSIQWFYFIFPPHCLMFTCLFSWGLIYCHATAVWHACVEIVSFWWVSCDSWHVMYFPLLYIFFSASYKKCNVVMSFLCWEKTQEQIELISLSTY